MLLTEIQDELSLASKSGFKSKHDDCLDAISMLGSMSTWRPSEEVELHRDDSGIWAIDEDQDKIISVLDESYIV
jgi:hypothetical protein